MKKTFTVNLGGTVFQIDEDAYQLIDNYLDKLKLHFSQEEGGEEIIKDMEARIAELFAVRLDKGKQVITLSDVEAIILQMGKLEDIIDKDADQDSRKVEPQLKKVRKQLFRDPDKKLLGGVCAGIASYTGWDLILIRLFTILFFGPLMMVYLICWIVIPPARTAEDKLAMRTNHSYE